MKITKLYRKWTTAMKAGWIAGGCPNCVVDDDAEAIFACFDHEDRIAELQRINEANW